MKTLTTAVVLALMFVPAIAAETFILPEKSDCGTVTLQVANGSGFRASGDRITSDHVAKASVWTLPNKRAEVEVSEGPQFLTFQAQVPAADAAPHGQVVMAAVTLKPTVNGNETRTEHAKALLFCGATPASDWQRSMDVDLELYPQGWNGPRPKLKAGETMRFIAVDKKTKTLLADLPMELYREGHGRVAKGVRAQHGGMNFEYPEPGRYMVVATHRRPDPQRQDHWLVDTSTLTFEVK